jgi:glycosyltransferase involved in cell wall biosynthesis
VPVHLQTSAAGGAKLAVAPELSIVIPVQNESPNIKPLYEELTQVLGHYGRSYELIIIDDGSTDDTFEQLAALQARDHRLRVIRFRRNFGQTAAFAAGFAHARGRLVVTSDGDLQNDPRDIPAIDTLIDQGNDIVCGQQADLMGDGCGASRLRLLAEGVPL